MLATVFTSTVYNGGRYLFKRFMVFGVERNGRKNVNAGTADDGRNGLDSTVFRRKMTMKH